MAIINKCISLLVEGLEMLINDFSVIQKLKFALEKRKKIMGESLKTNILLNNINNGVIQSLEMVNIAIFSTQKTTSQKYVYIISSKPYPKNIKVLQSNKQTHFKLNGCIFLKAYHSYQKLFRYKMMIKIMDKKQRNYKEAYKVRKRIILCNNMRNGKDDKEMNIVLIFAIEKSSVHILEKMMREIY